MMGMPVEQLKKVGDSFCISDFAENLFHDQPKYPGRLDSRVCLSQPLVLGANTYIDPALLALDGRMTKLTNALFRDVLGLKTKKKYKSFGLDIGRKWRYEGARSSIAELSGAMKKNPGMKLYCCSGYFDLAVTVRGIEQDLSLLNLTKELQGNIVHESFPAGHMMYSEPDIRKTITKSIVKSFDV
jgi:carboxypeptidase C (cathepsin A)